LLNRGVNHEDRYWTLVRSLKNTVPGRGSDYFGKKGGKKDGPTIKKHLQLDEAAESKGRRPGKGGVKGGGSR